MPTTETDPIRSGRWEMALPTGVTAEMQIDVEAGRWAVDVWRGDKRTSAVFTSTGKLEDADWFALAIAFGATPLPNV